MKSVFVRPTSGKDPSGVTGPGPFIGTLSQAAPMPSESSQVTVVQCNVVGPVQISKDVHTCNVTV